MPRDYKNAPRGQVKKEPIPAWVGFVAGLVVGLSVALLIYLRDNQNLLDEIKLVKTPPEKSIKALAAKQTDEKQSSVKKPRFDFYTILPEMEVRVPDWELANESKKEHKSLTGTSHYTLQAGSFRKQDEAERLKARLALLGIEADIQSVSVNGDDTWHRVRIGPVKDRKTVSEIRERLRRDHIEVLVLREKIP